MNKKKLILTRHGDAEPHILNKIDKDRKLTSIGEKKIKKLSTILRKEDLKSPKIIASTASRTLETAKILSENLNYDIKCESNEFIYNGNIQDYLSLFYNINKINSSIIIIGHSPVITEFGEYLVNKPIGHLQPGGVILIEFEIDEWFEIEKRTGKLIFAKNFLHGTFKFA